MWSQLVELQPQTTDSGSGISRDEFINGIATDIQVTELLLFIVVYCCLLLLFLKAKLPEIFKLDVIRKNYGEMISPTTVVLLQELERFNKLIKKMSSSLSNLQKVRRSSEIFIYLSSRHWLVRLG